MEYTIRTQQDGQIVEIESVNDADEAFALFESQQITLANLDIMETRGITVDLYNAAGTVLASHTFA